MDRTVLDTILAGAADRSRADRGRQQRDWLIYGAGRTGRKWAAAMARDGLTVHSFLDRQVQDAGGLPVCRAEDCPADLKQKCDVLVGLHNPGVDVAVIRTLLLAQGFRKVWLLQDLIDAWPELAHFWLAPACESLPFADDIRTAYGDLADEPSRRQFAALLDQRLNGAAERLPPPETDTHYLPRGLPRPPSPMRYIDCGAYTGDTIASFIKNDFAFDAIAAFEPDPAHFSCLCKSLAAQPAAVFPCGVWDAMTQLRFESDDSASHITDAGDITIQTVALDQALPSFAPTLIKMDIEGAESRALLGGRKLISTYRPQLAISTYHRPRDLWELQLLVRSWDLGYDFYLRTHCHNGFETVLYGIPT